MKKFIISIDQGTTSSRVVLFDTKGNIKFISQYEFKQHFPRNGWVEHNPNEIWSTTLKALKQVIKKAKSLKGNILTIGITDTSVLIAVIVYATIPATRYTIEGLRSVPVGLHEAATMSGVNKFQRLTKIEFPLAFPHMMLGLNQTIVFALFMVIIGAFIGTEDLGQYILKALSDKNGAGIGLTLGICVAFIGLIFDNLIRTWVEKRKKHLGIA